MAETYGKIIVRELHYRNERKLIKPIDLGGLIGGEKYVRAGILFKGFALDLSLLKLNFFKSCEPWVVRG